MKLDNNEFEQYKKIWDQVQEECIRELLCDSTQRPLIEPYIKTVKEHLAMYIKKPQPQQIYLSDRKQFREKARRFLSESFLPKYLAKSRSLTQSSPPAQQPAETPSQPIFKHPDGYEIERFQSHSVVLTPEAIDRVAGRLHRDLLPNEPPPDQPWLPPDPDALLDDPHVRWIPWSQIDFRLFFHSNPPPDTGAAGCPGAGTAGGEPQSGIFHPNRLCAGAGEYSGRGQYEFISAGCTHCLEKGFVDPHHPTSHCPHRPPTCRACGSSGHTQAEVDKCIKGIRSCYKCGLVGHEPGDKVCSASPPGLSDFLDKAYAELLVHDPMPMGERIVAPAPSAQIAPPSVPHPHFPPGGDAFGPPPYPSHAPPPHWGAPSWQSQYPPHAPMSQYPPYAPGSQYPQYAPPSQYPPYAPGSQYPPYAPPSQYPPHPPHAYQHTGPAHPDTSYEGTAPRSGVHAPPSGAHHPPSHIPFHTPYSQTAPPSSHNPAYSKLPGPPAQPSQPQNQQWT